MNRKLIKQLIYGSFYAALAALIIFLFYLSAFRSAPTCFDEKKNQNEEGVDCGGVCGSCALRQIAPIRVFPVRVLPAPDLKKSTILLQFQNPNAGYGASLFSYEVTFYSATGSPAYTFTNTSLLYPSEIGYRVEANVPVAFSAIAQAQARVLGQTWVERDNFSQPLIQTREVVLDLIADKKQIALTGVLKNNNPFTLTKVAIHAALYNETASLVAVSKTLVEGLAPLEERSFKIVLPVSDISIPLASLSSRLYFEAIR